MANYKLGDIIRMTRNASGMSREELCFGICSPKTLWRIENGKSNVKKTTYERLMARMGRIAEKSYAVCTSSDMELLEERTLLEDALMKYDYEKADEYLKILKTKVSDNLMNMQYIKNTEALLDFYNGRIKAEEQVVRMDEAIRLTVPDYESYLDEIYPYTEQELMILMRMANTYGKIGRHDKSIQIYKMILRCLDKGYIDGEEIINFKMIVMRNYSNSLSTQKKYEETLDILYEILELSLKNSYGPLISSITNDISWTKMQMYDEGDHSIDLEECKRQKRQAYYIAAARKDDKVKETIGKFYKKYFDEEINILD